MNYDAYWCSEFIKRFTDLGVNNFFIASGSRSSLIVSAIIKNKQCKVFKAIDERSLGFMALGWAKKNLFPSVIVVTSGTAVANLYPSIFEAYNSKIPLLIITADRPYELIDCNANQTIRQANIFSSCVAQSYDIAPPDEKVSLNLSINIATLAFMHAYEYQKAPVHINIQIRENTVINNLINKELVIKDIFLDKIDKCLIVVGEMPSSFTQSLILQIAKKYNWPIYADILSNIRLIKSDNIINNFELCLLNKKFINYFKDYTILYFGTKLVSKRFWQWLNKYPKKVFYFNNNSNSDQLGYFTQVIVSDLDNYLTKELAKNTFIHNCFSDAKKIAEKILLFSNKYLQEHVTEASFVIALIKNIKEEVLLFVSASMPIRYLDQFVDYAHYPIEVLSNRGVSGIDGVISSAIGAALNGKKRTILLLGDMAFVHDNNALDLLKQLSTPMLILVINNQGGGIFNLLPISNDKELLPFVTMPHEINFEYLCKAYDIHYKKIFSIDELVKSMQDYFYGNSHFVVEIISDSSSNFCYLKELYSKISEI